MKSMLRLRSWASSMISVLAVALHLVEQDSVGHHLDAALCRSVVGESDLITHLGPHIDTEFLREALGDTSRCDPAWLGVSDSAAAGATTQFETDLGQLRRLPRSRLARQNDDLMIANGRHDLLTAGRDGQVGGVLNGGHQGKDEGGKVKDEPERRCDELPPPRLKAGHQPRQGSLCIMVLPQALMLDGFQCPCPEGQGPSFS